MSDSAKRKRGKRRKPGQPLTKPCSFCGKEYPVQCLSRMERSKYCSHACRQRGRYLAGEIDLGKLKKRGGKPDNLAERKCETCGDGYKPTGHSQRWCRICSPDFNWSRRIARYGVTKPMWDAMLASQGGACALCDGEPIHVDHCHATGRVRGLLCYSCNLKLAGLDDAEWREKAEVYLAIRQ